MGDADTTLEKLAIRELVEAYNDAVMRFDGDDWSATWTEDAVWALPGAGEIRGREAILAVWKSAMADFTFVGFFASAGAIEIDGDHGTGRWWQQESLHYESGLKRAITGRYEDDYRRVEGRWRFQRRVYEILNAEDQAPATSR